MSEWNGELKLIAIDADRVVFLRNPADPMNLTIGRRYATAIVEIDDHENLVPTEPERTTVRRARRQPSNVAAILAKDARFQGFAARQMKMAGGGTLPQNEETATEYIRRSCRVSSRAELDIDMEALAVFHNIELSFYREVNDDGGADPVEGPHR